MDAELNVAAEVNDESRATSRAITRMRLDLGLNKSKLAKKLKVSNGTIGNWENEELSNLPNATQFKALQEMCKKKDSTLFTAQSFSFFIEAFERMPDKTQKTLLDALQKLRGDK
jgi:DNA-binding transcriptional regulator YiaG